jgi:hypothetical protein
MIMVEVRGIPALMYISATSSNWAYVSSSWSLLVISRPVFSGPASLLAMPQLEGLLEKIYSWPMDPFFRPKQSTSGSMVAPASATLVALVLLKEWMFIL